MSLKILIKNFSILYIIQLLYIYVWLLKLLVLVMESICKVWTCTYSIKERRLRGDLIKKLQFYYNINPKIIFKHSDITWWCNKKTSSYSVPTYFTERATSILHHSCKYLEWTTKKGHFGPSVESFKERLDHHWNVTYRHGSQ